MATIIKDDAQVAALQEIEERLKTVQVLNQIISSDANGVTLTYGEGKKAASIPVTEDKDAKQISAVCQRIRDRETKRITSLAQRHRIGLDAADKEILGLPAEG